MNRSWITCNNVNELKIAYGSYKNLCSELNKQFQYVIKFPKNGWEKTFIFLSKLKTVMNIHQDVVDLEKEKYIWALCYTDGMNRAKLLKITPELYNSKKLAKAWRNRILKLIAPDLNNNSEESNIATSKLNELFKGMIEYGK